MKLTRPAGRCTALQMTTHEEDAALGVAARNLLGQFQFASLERAGVPSAELPVNILHRFGFAPQVPTSYYKVGIGDCPVFLRVIDGHKFALLTIVSANNHLLAEGRAAMRNGVLSPVQWTVPASLA